MALTASRGLSWELLWTGRNHRSTRLRYPRGPTYAKSAKRTLSGWDSHLSGSHIAPQGRGVMGHVVSVGRIKGPYTRPNRRVAAIKGSKTLIVNVDAVMAKVTAMEKKQISEDTDADPKID
jgi:hypothetical protein